VLLVQIWQASGDDLFRRAATETADWVLRDMRSPEGAFYSTLDADSEGEEGRFYVWKPAELEQVLNSGERTALSVRFGLDQGANFEGSWHLQVRGTLEEAAAKAGETHSATSALLDSARARLLAVRNERVWPGRDEKVLTAWNALMIRGLSMTGRALQRDDCIDSAAAAADFIRSTLYVEDVLQACYKDGRARFRAYLDDYAFLLDALLELLQARWNAAHLDWAIELADALLDEFSDAERGGFYFTSVNHEQLVHRTRSFSDDSLPSGNAVAAQALARLGHLLGDTRYLDAAEHTLRAGYSAMVDFPHGHAALVIALDEYLDPPEIVVIRGAHEEASEWAQAVAAIYAPSRLVFAIPDTAEALPGALAARAPGVTTRAYICKGMTCGLPVTSREALAAELSEA